MDLETDPTVTPHGLHLDYDVDFWCQSAEDIAPTLTSPLLPSLVKELLRPEKPLPARPPPPLMDLPQPPDQLPPHPEVGWETARQPPPHQETAQESLSPESPSSEDRDGMSVVSSRPETPGSLKVKFPFQKRKKEDGSGGAPGKVPPSQPEVPSGEEEERVCRLSF